MAFFHGVDTSESVPRLDPSIEFVCEMSSVNTVDEDCVPILNHRTPCQHRSKFVRCTCEDPPFDDDVENSPLITYQSHSGESYLTDIHCHEAKPIHSNAKARRKLLIASIVCLLFVIAEVVGKLVFRKGRF